MSHGGSDAAALKDEGNKLFLAEQYLKAAATYTQAIKIDPGNAVLYSNRSAALLKLKKVAKALEDAEKCIEIKPEWDKGYFRKGSVMEELSKLPEALEVYHIAFKLNPDNQELNQKIRTLSKVCNKQGLKTSSSAASAPTKAAPAPAATAGASVANTASSPTRDQPAEPLVFEDLGSESVAAFAEEYLKLLADEIREHGTDFIPMVHMLPGSKAQTSDEVQPHIRGAGAWETPQMLEGFMGFLRSGAAQLDAEAVLALVPKSAIGWPQTWCKPKWHCGDGPGVFAQLESRQVRKLWFVPVTGPNPWQPGTPVSLDSETFGPLPGRILKP